MVHGRAQERYVHGVAVDEHQARLRDNGAVVDARHDRRFRDRPQELSWETRFPDVDFVAPDRAHGRSWTWATAVPGLDAAEPELPRPVDRPRPDHPALCCANAERGHGAVRPDARTGGDESSRTAV